MSIFFLPTETDCPKVPKGARKFDLSRYSNSIFSEFSGSICCIKTSIEIFWSCHKSIDYIKSSGLVSPINVSIESSKFVEKKRKIDWEIFNLILVLKYWCPKTHWRFLVLNHLAFQNHVSPLVEAWYLPSRFQSERNNLSRRLGWKDVDFLPCNRNLMVRKLQNILWTLADIDIITQFSRKFQVWFVASRFHSIFFELSQINRLKFSRFFLLHQKPVCTKVPKNDFHTELTESSNLLFCVATRLVSPINVSVESSIIVEKGSFEKFLIWFLYQNFNVRKRTEGYVLNHLGFQNHVSTLVEAWFFPSWSQSKSFSFEQAFRLKRCRFSSLQQKPDGPKVPKVFMNFGLSRYYNSIFSEFSGSICCIKISIDFFWSCHKSIDQIKSIGLVSPINVSIESSIIVEKNPLTSF